MLYTPVLHLGLVLVLVLLCTGLAVLHCAAPYMCCAAPCCIRRTVLPKLVGWAPKGGIFMGRMFPDIEGTGAVYCSLGISHLFSTKTWLRHVSCSVLGGVLVCVLAVCWRRVCVLTICWRRVGDFGNMLETDEKREDDSEEKRRGKRRL